MGILVIGTIVSKTPNFPHQIVFVVGTSASRYRHTKKVTQSQVSSDTPKGTNLCLEGIMTSQNMLT